MKILALGAHPDDIEIFMYGLIFVIAFLIKLKSGLLFFFKGVGTHIIIKSDINTLEKSLEKIFFLLKILIFLLLILSI